jgi:hypothetical protein
LIFHFDWYREQKKAPSLGRFAALYENFANEVVPCHAITDMDFTPWRDSPTHFARRPRSVDNFLLRITGSGIHGSDGLAISLAEDYAININLKK